MDFFNLRKEFDYIQHYLIYLAFSLISKWKA